MIIIISKVASIFALILVGVVAFKIKVLTEDSRIHFTNLLLNITSPALILSASTTIELNEELMINVKNTLLLSIIYYLIGSVIIYFIFKLLRLKPIEDIGVFIVAIIAINCGFMGFPISKSIFGDEIFFLFVIHNLLFYLYIFGAGPIIFTIGDSKKLGLKNIVKLFKTPSLIASVATIIILVLDLSIPVIVSDLLVMIGNITIPLSMIIIGIQLAQSNIITIIKNKNIIIASLISMFLIPFITFLLLDPLSFISDAVKLTIIFVTAFPAAVVPTMLAEKQGKNSLFIAETISLTTIISLITIPVIAMMLTSQYQGF